MKPIIEDPKYPIVAGTLLSATAVIGSIIVAVVIGIIVAIIG